MMKKVIVAVAGFCIALAGVIYAGEKSSGDAMSPVGVWKTIDDGSNEEKSYVEIYRNSDGTLSGKIVKLLSPPKPDNPNQLCIECSGEKKDQPILGMVIMWDMQPKKKGETQKWHNGHILDPDNGQVYGCNLTVIENGKQLEVRGFIGFSLLGRTQTWHRIQ